MKLSALMNSCKRQPKSTSHADVTEIPKEEPKSGMTKDELAEKMEEISKDKPGVSGEPLPPAYEEIDINLKNEEHSDKSSDTVVADVHVSE